MRKLSLVIVLALVCGTAWATLRQAPRFYQGVDGFVTTVDTVLVDANIYYVGVTVGNKIELREGSASGTVFCSIVADTANGNKKCSYPEAIFIDGGIYYDHTIAGGGTGMNYLTN
jgi:hypothetical protein